MKLTSIDSDQQDDPQFGHHPDAPHTARRTDMTLYRLDASIRAEGSASREIADIV